MLFNLKPDPPAGLTVFDCMLMGVTNTTDDTTVALDCTGPTPEDSGPYTLTYGVTDHVAPVLPEGASVELRTRYSFGTDPYDGGPEPPFAEFALIDASGFAPRLVAAGLVTHDLSVSTSNMLTDDLASLSPSSSGCDPYPSCEVPIQVGLGVNGQVVRALSEHTAQLEGLRLSVASAVEFPPECQIVDGPSHTYHLMIEALP